MVSLQVFLEYLQDSWLVGDQIANQALASPQSSEGWGAQEFMEVVMSNLFFADSYEVAPQTFLENLPQQPRDAIQTILAAV